MNISYKNKKSIGGQIKYTDDDMNRAIDLYRANYTLDEIYYLTKVSKYSLRIKFKKLGILRKTTIKYNPKLEEAIKLYKNGLPLMKASKQAGTSFETLRRHLKKFDLVRSNKENSRKYTLNNDYFQDINEEHKAYWLGFMFADGYLSKRKTQKSVGISIHERDKQHLEKMKNFIGATYPINSYVGKGYNGKSIRYVRLLMTSDKMFDDLKDKGCVEHKSLVLKFPHKVPESLVHHFIRGYFDGDGSFKKNCGSYKIGICGTKELLKSILSWFGLSHLKLYKRYKDNKNNFCIDIGGRQQVKRLASWFYKDATVFLDRKHKRYLELLKD